MIEKQLKQLQGAYKLEKIDKIIIRKVGDSADSSLTGEKLQESLGNSAVSGYQASSSVANQIDLVAANGTIITAYIEGMTISFISPIATTSTVNVQIDGIGLILLEQYNIATTVTLAIGDYVEAVYNGVEFKQTNKLNTDLVYSNEYNATGVTEGFLPGAITTYTLTSAIGVKKASYYKGMPLLFTVPLTSQGVIFVNVDGLPDIQLIDDDPIINQILAGDLVAATYNNENFVKREFANIVKRETYVADEAITLPTLSEDRWAPADPGNLDDPASADGPDSTDTNGKPFFVTTVTVGIGGDFATLEDAIAGLIKKWGITGAGKKAAIVMKTGYIPVGIQRMHLAHTPATPAIPASWSKHYGVNKWKWRRLRQAFVPGKPAKINYGDLDWLSIFSQDDSFIDFSDAFFLSYAGESPILNCKITVNRTTLDASKNGLFTGGEGRSYIFGKKAEINYSHILEANKTIPIILSEVNITALYGLKINSTNPLFTGNILINKGDLTYTSLESNELESNELDFMKFSPGDSHIYNTDFHDTTGFFRALISVDVSSRLHLQNVESSDRTGLTKGIEGANINMKNCRFASSVTTDIDIMIAGGNSESKIILDPTGGGVTGRKNQAFDLQTNDGTIIEGNV